MSVRLAVVIGTLGVAQIAAVAPVGLVALNAGAPLALFQPLRARIQQAVDRRFDRFRHDATRIFDSISTRLRDGVDLESVRAGLLDAVRDTVQPAPAGVWLRERR